MAADLALAAALPVQMAALFAFWTASRARSRGWLALGCLAAAAFAVLLWLGATMLSGRIVAGFFGTYIVAALLWAWWRDGLRPASWNPGEAAVAVLAAGLFAIAVSAG